MANNKYCGNVSDYQPVLEDASRVVISYGLTELGDGKAEWYEVVFYKKQGKPSFEAAKKAILADIDKQTDEKILNGYEFTPDGADTPIIVWLSKENQTNFSEAHRLQIVPIKFKLNETEDKQPIYHEFETFEELDRFYKGGVRYINQCLNEGWARKDSIDWTPYAEALQPVTDQTQDGGEKKSTRKK
jgi:hypothetical protein